MTSAQIVAAGGVVVRSVAGETQFILVHRPHHQDWSLPKGKQDAGETPSQTALREVLEEVGLQCELGEPLDSVRYFEPQRGKDKVVHYWLMCPLNADQARVDGDECDAFVWATPDQAMQMLTYDTEKRVVAQAIDILQRVGDR